MLIYSHNMDSFRWNAKVEWCYHNTVEKSRRAITIRWARKWTIIVLWEVKVK